jgi:hypothetical protein
VTHVLHAHRTAKRLPIFPIAIVRKPLYKEILRGFTANREGSSMRRAAFLLAAVAVFLATAAAAPADRSIVAGEMSGVVPAKGAGKARASSPLLLYHGGTVMTSTAVTSIFWGQSWANSSFSGDKLSGLDSFYAGSSRSSYLGTNTEYYGSNGTVDTTISSSGHLIDTSPVTFKRQPQTSDILGEVAKMISHPVANGYYPVYTDVPRGHAGYCAWHSFGTINGVPVQFAFFFNLDGDPGCDPGAPYYGHSQGLAALANVSGHELSEVLTDPRNGGWWDSSGEENADKCAWTFSGNAIAFGSTSWKIQGNFSNNAYNSRSGYDHGGCIDGT